MSEPTYPLQNPANQALVIAAPTFANITVVDGSWKEKDATKHKEYEGGANNTTLFFSFRNPGADCSCKAIVNYGQTVPFKGQSLVSTETTPRKWVILGVDLEDVGAGDPVMVSLELARRDSVTPT